MRVVYLLSQPKLSRYDHWMHKSCNRTLELLSINDRLSPRDDFLKLSPLAIIEPCLVANAHVQAC